MPTVNADPAPPIPNPVLRIGVTGHRPDRLQGVPLSVLTEQIRTVLDEIAKVARYAGVARLCLISSLAEGADRLAASVAVDLGYELVALLPMAPDQYEQDFSSDESAAEFRRLIQGRTVFTLPSTGSDRTKCYVAASGVLISNSDLLLAIWDRLPSNGAGGTADTIAAADAQETPTVVIAAHGDARISFENSADSMAALAVKIRELCIPSSGTLEEIEAYKSERWPLRYPSLGFVILRWLAEGRLVLPEHPHLSGQPHGIQTEAIVPYFRWMDTLAIYYGERSRSASARLQILAATSVAAALMNVSLITIESVSRTLSVIEVGAVLSLLFSIFQARRSHWHDRWLRYRVTAEQLRCVDLLTPMGLSTRLPIDTGEQLGGSKMLFAPWMIRSLERELTLPSVVMDEATLRAQITKVRRTLVEQQKFHQGIADRYTRAEERLHHFGLSFFAFAAVLSAYGLMHSYGWLPTSIMSLIRVHSKVELVISTLAALLPAMGASASAYVAQGEFKRLAERSRNMRNSLGNVLSRVPAAEAGPSLTRVVALSLSTAEVLSGETREWSDMLASRPPALPL